MVLEIIITAGIAFGIGYAVGTPKTVEQEVTKNIETERCDIAATAGGGASGGRSVIESVEAESVSMMGAQGGSASGTVSVSNVEAEEAHTHK